MQAQEKFSILLVDDDLMVVRVLNGILSDFSPESEHTNYLPEWPSQWQRRGL
jgi:CheY-like chemotaxis protein